MTASFLTTDIYQMGRFQLLQSILIKHKALFTVSFIQMDNLRVVCNQRLIQQKDSLYDDLIKDKFC